MLSLVLRHAPEKIDLQLDAGGWASVEKLIQKMNENGVSINLEILQKVVATNDKKRFSFQEDFTRIRANQGHSIQIEHGFVPREPPEILFHGTGEKSLESILKTGIDTKKASSCSPKQRPGNSHTDRQAAWKTCSIEGESPRNVPHRIRLLFIR